MGLIDHDYTEVNKGTVAVTALPPEVKPPDSPGRFGVKVPFLPLYLVGEAKMKDMVHQAAVNAKVVAKMLRENYAFRQFMYGKRNRR